MPIQCYSINAELSCYIEVLRKQKCRIGCGITCKPIQQDNIKHIRHFLDFCALSQELVVCVSNAYPMY